LSKKLELNFDDFWLYSAQLYQVFKLLTSRKYKFVHLAFSIPACNLQSAPDMRES